MVGRSRANKLGRNIYSRPLSGPLFRKVPRTGGETSSRAGIPAWHEVVA